MNFRGVLLGVIMAIILVAAAGLILFAKPIEDFVHIKTLEAEAAWAKHNAQMLEAKENLEQAKKETIIAEGQATAIVTAVETSNRLIALWGVMFPAMPFIWLGIGATFGGPTGFLAGVVVGAGLAVWRINEQKK